MNQSNKIGPGSEFTEAMLEAAIELMTRKSPADIVRAWRAGVYVRGSVDPDLRISPWPWGESWRSSDMLEGDAREFALNVMADNVEARLVHLNLGSTEYL